jgi:aspartate 1-decarboxylase
MESELKDFHPTLVYVDAKNQVTAKKSAIERILS